MKERRLNPGSGGVEHIGILPTGELYIDREMIGDDLPDYPLTEYLAAADVARLKSLLAIGGSMADGELLDLLACRFKRGYDILQWLQTAGIPTEPRLDDRAAGRLEVQGPAAAMKLDSLASSKAFAPRAKFYDVEGVPVALESTPSGGLGARAVDPTPRYFPVNSVFRGGTEISRETFDDMVREFREAQNIKQSSAAWPADD